MEINDLRIGNFFSKKDIITCKNTELGIVSLSTLHRLNQGEDVGEYSPLTEEWLFKFGFNKIQDRIVIKCGSSDLALTCPKSIDDWQDYFIWVFDKYRFIKLEYVHEVQNLYYTMCKNELQLKT